MTKWRGGYVPDAGDGGADSIAMFGPVNSAARVISLNSNQTVGTLVFDSANRYTLSGAASAWLTVDAPAGQRGWIDVPRGSHVIAANVRLNADATIAQSAGATLTIQTLVGAVAGKIDVGPHAR